MIDGIYLLLGTNLGDKKSNLLKAKALINRQLGTIINQSYTYETAAWGITDQASFLNEVVEIKSILTPKQMLSKINEIEKEMGRVRQVKWGERLIDIDILYFQHQVHSTDNLKIPHPGIPDRRFTLIPLVELNAAFNHPLLNKTNQQLLDQCKDSLQVKKVG